MVLKLHRKEHVPGRIWFGCFRNDDFDVRDKERLPKNEFLGAIQFILDSTFFVFDNAFLLSDCTFHKKNLTFIINIL
ncbi:hypothetical protein ALC60_04690 [Trachymyrmex zeteki]|uniref:Uncharacterized protein n=1 Tax=Mycetomoellerius zeteki TaxID=64791 RepID=A0A151X7N0_9HYME|nr:hypothetical protein ALC60_04690 [Trachymyrmex zeteki]